MVLGQRGAMGSHQLPNGGVTNEWLTPPEIVEDLGPFDLDPCSPDPRPWPTAYEHISLPDDGLTADWHGMVWLNPPYGAEAAQWLAKLADHGDGIALIFARTETKMFFESVWDRADALLFLKGRLFFYRPNGVQANANAGAPSVLVAYGQAAVERLRNSAIEGAFVSSWA